jgi:hypothetical protein
MLRATATGKTLMDVAFPLDSWHSGTQFDQGATSEDTGRDL